MSMLTMKTIMQTFSEMIEEMPFDKITVLALVKRCEINHNTFYYHFQDLYELLDKCKNVNIKIDIFSCFYRFAILHNTQPVLLCIFTFRQRSTKAATAASLSRSLYPLLCKLLYLFLE